MRSGKRRSLEADRLSSVLFYGPPGTGKTTLAQLIANYSQSHFEQVNAIGQRCAVEAADARAAVASAGGHIEAHEGIDARLAATTLL